MSSKIKSARDFKCESKKDLVSYIENAKNDTKLIALKKPKENICVFAHKIFYILILVNFNSKEAAYINLIGYTYNAHLITKNDKDEIFTLLQINACISSLNLKGLKPRR
jgi:hypothetical protein